jgi:hypothetical protein
VKTHLQAVEKVKNEFNNVLGLSPDVICTINSQVVFVSITVAAEKTSGYAPTELNGNRYWN